MAKLVKLPSGLVVNMDQVITIEEMESILDMVLAIESNGWMYHRFLKGRDREAMNSYLDTFVYVAI